MADLVVAREGLLGLVDVRAGARNLFDSDGREPAPATFPEDYPIAGRSLFFETALRFCTHADVGEEEFADTLAQSLRSGEVSEPTGAVSLKESGILDVWSQMDDGKIEDADEGLRKLHGG